ncbi:ras-domain-containing protein [Fragilariopsis cylindrus CCMP1102]|uniref:Ras-domain-containing protein n=1 Tax=Fragilariopsis cylindrus CCMP1102 TaxID=635003 RepID=A0A1E7FZA1_9STRA|nr:ras-domain-containing protein [Fragilariopsis cylindrus CCMP1102]|eukprot:OEU23444.1 ras-domain-containing protein [Fragilariopsis cylindrus CCMP1102]
MSGRATSTPGGKPPLYKIVMLGDSGVGKTSLVARLTNPDRPLNHDISATMGIEFDTQMLDTPQGHKVKAQIWDTAGQERFARVLLPTYFRKAKGVILVYDITNIKSFESLSERWMTQLNDHSNSDDLAKLLVGNKSDLTSESSGDNSSSSREVTAEKAMSFCQEYGMEFLETSAKSGNNVLTAFEKLIGIVHDRALNNNNSSSSNNNNTTTNNKNNSKSTSGSGQNKGGNNNNNKSESSTGGGGDDDGTVNLNASGNEGGDDSGACGC